MKSRLALALVLALASCDVPNSAEPNAYKKIDKGEVALIATAPDGTKLWGVSAGGYYVYFSSAGTDWSYTCGKSCQRHVQVPNSP
jgi:hypothetical protein